MTIIRLAFGRGSVGGRPNSGRPTGPKDLQNSLKFSLRLFVSNNIIYILTTDCLLRRISDNNGRCQNIIVSNMQYFGFSILFIHFISFDLSQLSLQKKSSLCAITQTYRSYARFDLSSSFHCAKSNSDFGS